MEILAVGIAGSIWTGYWAGGITAAARAGAVGRTAYLAARAYQGYAFVGDVVGLRDSYLAYQKGTFTPLHLLGFAPTIGWAARGGAALNDVATILSRHPRLNPLNYIYRLAGLPTFIPLHIKYGGPAFAPLRRRASAIVDLGVSPNQMYANVARDVRGFRNRGEVLERVGNLHNRLRDIGVDDAVIGIRGSSITGISSKGGPWRSFDGELTRSDVDFFIVSPTLQRKGEYLGIFSDGRVRPENLAVHFPAVHNVFDGFAVQNIGQLGRNADVSLLHANLVNGLDPRAFYLF